MYSCLLKMRKINFEYFLKKYISKKDTMNKSELQRVYNYPIYPRGSEIYSDKGFVNKDNGSQGGTHWTCFIIKENRSYYCDSLSGQPDKFLPKQLPKTRI